MSPPWMPLYIGDYLKDTTRLSTAEHGAYLLLIMDYWVNGGLPAEDDQLALIVRMSEKDWLRIKPKLKPLFKEGWRHTRIDLELAKATEKNSRRVEAGKRGGNAKADRYQKGSNAKTMPEANAQHDNGNALASSSQSQRVEPSQERESGSRSPTGALRVVPPSLPEIDADLADDRCAA